MAFHREYKLAILNECKESIHFYPSTIIDDWSMWIVNVSITMIEIEWMIEMNEWSQA